MGNKNSTFCDTFLLDSERKDSEKNIYVKGIYLDCLAFPLSGIIGISQNKIENFNAINGTKLSELSISDINITCCDYSQSERIISIGYSDGKVRIISSENLKVLATINYDPKLMQTANIGAVNCRLPGKIIIGYSNGITKEFKLNEPTCAFNVFLTVDLTNPENKALPISHIEICKSGNLVFIGQNNDSAKNSIIRICHSGSSSSKININCNCLIASLQVLERYKAILVIGINRQIFAYSYEDGEQLANFELLIPNLVSKTSEISAVYSIPYSAQLRKIYEKEIQAGSLDQAEQIIQGKKGDLIYFGFNTGLILSGRFEIAMQENKIQCNFLPFNVYKANKKLSNEIPSKISCLYVDPVTDRLLACTENTIKIIEHSILRMLNPEKAHEIDEEIKEKSASWAHKIGLGTWEPIQFLFSKKSKKKSPEFHELQETKINSPIRHNIIESPKIEKRKKSFELEAQKMPQDIKKTQESREIIGRLAKVIKNSPKEEDKIPNFVPENTNHEIKESSENSKENIENKKEQPQSQPVIYQHQSDTDIKIDLQ